MTHCQKSNFNDHIARIKFAKEKASEIFAEFDLPTRAAMASLSYAWEMLFDSICQGNDQKLGELKNISSVIQMLSTSHKKIQEIEFKKTEMGKSTELDDERQKLRTARENFQRGKLPSDVVKTVEEQLQLL
ncbi:MAG: hypothetical protein LBB18_00105 [Puniceicoccales bacterium]|jgi:type IV secretory pathway component VirB8|nr:hypothetical protein [Puniceicoccales bacterium]